jgi:DNA-binding MarR family transcriptional regulator
MPLQERLGTDLHRVHQQLMSVKATVLRPTGLTVPQYSALYLLAQAPGMSGAALARVTQVAPQSTFSLLRNLQAAGLVERRSHPWHRSVIEFQLTAAGHRALGAADAAASAIERQLASGFTEDERRTLRALLERCSSELASLAHDRAADDSDGDRPT